MEVNHYDTRDDAMATAVTNRRNLAHSVSTYCAKFLSHFIFSCPNI